MVYEVELGKKIRELRTKAGLTIDKTAKLVGVNAVHMAYIEKDSGGNSGYDSGSDSGDSGDGGSCD